MNREISPSGIAAPAANYAHAVHSEHVMRWLHTSGVVPVRPDGSVPTAMSDQADVVWANLLALLGDADMTVRDVVSITTYVVAEQLAALPTVMAARDRVMGRHRAASTLVTVPALARHEWKLEIAVVAAR